MISYSFCLSSAGDDPISYMPSQMITMCHTTHTWTTDSRAGVRIVRASGSAELLVAVSGHLPGYRPFLEDSRIGTNTDLL